MGYVRYTRARIDSRNPAALAVCDRCGLVYNHHKLRWQYDWRGPNLQDLGILICPSCMDEPQEQLRSIVLPPDPVPIIQPRPGEFASMVISSSPDSYATIVPNWLATEAGDYLTTELGENLIGEIQITPTPHGYIDGSAPAETGNAVDFDGTTTYLTRGAGVTGVVDSPTGIFSVWVRLDGGDGTTLSILCNTSLKVDISRLFLNRFQIGLIDPTSTSMLAFRSVSSYTASATWLHILASWNVNAAVGSRTANLYINDVSDLSIPLDTGAAFNVEYTDSNWAVGARTSGSFLFDGCMAEVYFAPGQFLDFSVTANRRKFITVGKPADLGSDGSTPTGIAPILYLNNVAQTFGVNKGTGGDFTVTGTLTPANTTPWD